MTDEMIDYILEILDSVQEAMLSENNFAILATVAFFAWAVLAAGVNIVPYFLGTIGNVFIFSIAPAIWHLVKKMKTSNAHGDSTSEFNQLNGSKMHITYANDTIFALQYMYECEKRGIGSSVKIKQMAQNMQVHKMPNGGR